MSIEKLAAEMNVSKSDVLMLAQSVANSMKADKLNSSHANSETVEAYVVHAVKKFDSFVTTYLTNESARMAFIESVK